MAYSQLGQNAREHQSVKIQEGALVYKYFRHGDIWRKVGKKVDKEVVKEVFEDIEGLSYGGAKDGEVRINVEPKH